MADIRSLIITHIIVSKKPLADKIRPTKFSEVIGQDHLFGEDGALSIVEKSKNVPSIIFWGPTGVGKTTIAKILAKISKCTFVFLSAINSGAADIRKTIADLKRSENKTILLIDEIHHYNKTQQDLFLPAIEDGSIILIGTTTENPSFHLNSALLSRCKVLTLNSLEDEDLLKIISRAQDIEEKKLPLDEEVKNQLVGLCCGDARYLLNACEELFSLDVKENLTFDKLYNVISKRAAHFDKGGDFHYNLISAFHKSLRGSDVNAALFYLARMLEAKQDPFYILRRMARFATEDIGLADPNALLQVMAAVENYKFLGSPEGDYALSHACIYLATAPKSNASYLAHKSAIKLAQNYTNIMPPKNILNAPTKLMKEQGYHEGYIYDHDVAHCFSGQEFFPEEVLNKDGRPEFYQPNERGFERDIKKRMDYWKKLKSS
ncbi:MAG: replication-associated recombination protein A [Rickettsiales bacterium]|nr:replication-associated recombination protein A [Rickettsiales bacterium]